MVIPFIPLRSHTFVHNYAQSYYVQNVITVITVCCCVRMPILVATRSKAWVCGRSLAGIGVRIPPPAWAFVSCECCVLSGRGLCVGPITLPEESYRERERERVCVCVCVYHKCDHVAP
jgi:hypothetical protein